MKYRVRAEGKTLHVDAGRKKIRLAVADEPVALLFHPLSKHHLLVCAKDGTVRVCNLLSSNAQLPESVYVVAPKYHAHTFVAFTLDPLDYFAVYALSDTGTVHVVHILPHHFDVPRTVLRSIPADSELYRMLEHASADQSSVLHCSVTYPGNAPHHYPRKHSAPSVHLDIKPRMINVESSLDIELNATDFIISSSMEGQHSVSMIYICYNGGYVDFGILGENIQILETIQIPDCEDPKLKYLHKYQCLVTDEKIGIWYLSGDQSARDMVQADSISSWFEKQRASGFVNVSTLYTGPFDSITVADQLIITRAGSTYNVNLPFFSSVSLPSPEELDLNQSNSILAEYPITKALPFIHRSISSSAVDVSVMPITQPISQSKSGLSIYPEGLTKEAYEYGGGAILSLNDNLRVLSTHAESFAARRQLLEQESKRQVDMVSKVEADIANLLQRSEMNNTRAKECTERQHAISQRIDLILTILMEHIHPDLNQYELNWIKELDGIRNAIPSFHKRFENISQLLQQHVSSSSPPNKSNDEEEVGGFQLGKLGGLVKAETDYFDDLAKSVRRIQIQVDSLEQ